MKRLVLCMVSVQRREYMSERDFAPETSLKHVWVAESETSADVVERHFNLFSDAYGTSWSVRSVDEVETIGNP